MGQEQRSSEIGLIALTVLVIAAAGAVTYWNVSEDRETTRQASFKLSDSLAASIAMHADAALRDASNAAYSAALLIEKAGGLSAFRDERHLHEELKRELADNESTVRLAVTDALGRVIASSSDYPVPQVSLGDGESFKWHQSRPEDGAFRIGMPVKSAIGGELVFPYSRVIFGSRRELSGMIAAELKVGHFTELYKVIINLNRGVISLFSTNGHTLVRMPDPEKYAGQTLSPALVDELLRKPGGNMELASPRDGILRYYSWHRMKRHPMIVVVGLDVEDALASWRTRTRQRLTAMSAGSAGLVALVVLLIFYLRRLARTQVRLTETELRLRSAMENSAIGVVLASAEGRWLDVNPALCTILGYTREELLERGPDLLADEVQEEPGGAVLRDLKAGRIANHQAERSFRHRNGHEVWAHISASIARSVLGEPLNLIVQVQDITERRQAENEIRQLNADLERRVADRTAELSRVNKDLEAFSYSVAHDLRGPLNRISSFTDLLRRDLGERGGGAPGRLDTIQRQVKQMSGLIESLLRLARTSHATLRRQKVDLGALLSEAREQLAADTAGRNVTWNIGALPEVQADAVLMREVLANLIGNALKFTRGRDPAVITIGTDDAAAKPGEIAIFVRDNGAGFDMQNASRLFTPFHRMHGESEFEGSGVGLATVQRIVERHGGRIWASSAVGQGATFSFALPA